MHTPLVQFTVPIDPTSVARAKALDVAFVTTLLLASFTVTVIVEVPLIAMEIGAIASVEVAALAAPNVVVMFPLVPESTPSVPVTVCTVPAVVLLVNVTVACPAASVTELAAEKLPPFVLDHVTVLPLVAITLPLASANCAVIVTVLPAITELALDVTTYFVAVGAGAEMVRVLGLPEMFVAPIFAVSDAVAAVPGAVYVAVHTPFVQLTVPSVPRSTAAVTSLDVAVVITLPFASFTVIVTVVVPFVSSDVEPTANVLVAALGAPVLTLMFGLVLAVFVPSVASLAVTVFEPTVLSVTLNVFVPATSAPFAGSVAAPSLDVIATLSVDDTTFQFASTAFTVTVNPVPDVCALGAPVLPVALPADAASPGTRICTFANGPAMVVMLPLVPVMLEPSVAVTVCAVPATVLAVNVTVARPFASVVLVALANDPPFVLDQVIVRPAVFTELFEPSASCAVIVTEPPSVTLLALDVTTYFDAAPAAIVSLAALPDTLVPPIFAVMLALPAVDGAV